MARNRWVFKQLKKYEFAYKYSIDYIKEKNSNCWLILNTYKKLINSNSDEPIIIPGIRETRGYNFIIKKKKLRKLLKAITPYGLIDLKKKKAGEIA